MQTLSRFARRLKAAIVFYRELRRYGVDYRRFPKQFQTDLALAIRALVGGDRAAEIEHTRMAALAVAAAASAEFARRANCFSDPAKRRRLKPLALIVVPLLDRHGVQHQFQWPAHDPDGHPERVQRIAQDGVQPD